MTQQTGDFDFSSVMAQYGPISNEYYEQLVAEWQTSLDSAAANPFSISPTINVTPNYNITGLPTLLTTYNAMAIISTCVSRARKQFWWHTGAGKCEHVSEVCSSWRRRAERRGHYAGNQKAHEGNG